MKRVILTFAVLIGLTAMMSAQDYSTGIGLRGGAFNGLTIKHFIAKSKAVEGIVDTRWGGFEVCGLLEFHKTAFDVNRLKWFYGAGAHLGAWEGNTNWGDKGKSYIVIGVDGILGLEYSIEEIPVSISLDWKPAINLIGYSDFWPEGGGLSIRYIF